MQARHQPRRLAVIGCGHIWRTIYRPIIASLPGAVRLEAVCDMDGAAASRAAAAFPGARAYTAAESLLRREAPEAVLVLTSESANASVASLALRAGVPVYLEKPPSESIRGWERLVESETNGAARVFAAFNRRHTPLFRRWQCPPGLRRVRGVMSRRGRPPERFPYTAVHLIDSAQYFSGRTLGATHIVPGARGEWRIAGAMADGVGCDLAFLPDGRDHCEYLIFETEGEAWEMHFPNPLSARYHEGRLVCVTRQEDVRGAESDPLEAMGYAPCFRAFLDSLDEAPESASHRVESCYPTVALLEHALSAMSSRRGASQNPPNPTNEHETLPIA